MPLRYGYPDDELDDHWDNPDEDPDLLEDDDDDFLDADLLEDEYFGDDFQEDWSDEDPCECDACRAARGEY